MTWSHSFFVVTLLKKMMYGFWFFLLLLLEIALTLGGLSFWKQAAALVISSEYVWKAVHDIISLGSLYGWLSLFLNDACGNRRLLLLYELQIIVCMRIFLMNDIYLQKKNPIFYYYNLIHCWLWHYPWTFYAARISVSFVTCLPYLNASGQTNENERSF